MYVCKKLESFDFEYHYLNVLSESKSEIFVSEQSHFQFFHLQLKSAYAIAKLRRTGYSKQKFYQEAINLYKEVRYLLLNFNYTMQFRSFTFSIWF